MLPTAQSHGVSQPPYDFGTALLFPAPHASIELGGKSVMLDWSNCPVLESIPGKVSGAWVFRGTRVPVSAILKNLKHMTLDQLVGDYPSVQRAQIEAVLDFLARSADPVLLGEPGPAIVVHAHPPR
ncbi:MAG: DUF433 domain-containing protein [Bryobacteraceae bacterium]